MSDHLGYGATDDRTMPAVTYGLYLLTIPTGGLTALVGIILAHVQQGSAGPVMRSHYTLLIRTFWIGLVISVLNALFMGVAMVFSLILIGLPFLLLSWLVFGVIGAWFYLRCIVGVIYLARGEAYPRPYALLA